MTQKQLADELNVSDKAVSKWERGLGCPDLTLLAGLGTVFAVNIAHILSGDLEEREADTGNMKKIAFYVCQNCGNILYSMSSCEVSCCGRKLPPLSAQEEDEAHCITVADIEDEQYVSMTHEMSKTHFISFAALVSGDRVVLVKLYPEQNAELRLPFTRTGVLYVYCNIHGLYKRAWKV